MDNKLKILLLLHFAVKQKDKTHSSEQSYIFTGLSQNKISQYIWERCKMPRTSKIAMAQHVMYSLGIKGETSTWLDGLSRKDLNSVYVNLMLDQIKRKGRLASARGRTEGIAQKILKMYSSVT